MEAKSLSVTAMETGTRTEHRLRACWLTVNRACNLRCAWCYAAKTGFSSRDDLRLPDAKRAVDFCAGAGIKVIILIGGEPTVYPHIFELLQYIHQRGLRSAVVTNGVILSDKGVLEHFLASGANSFSVSLKANDRDEYKTLTGRDFYPLVLKAIKNMSLLKVHFGVTSVLTTENIKTFPKGIRRARKAGAHNFSFGFCYNFNCDGASSFVKENNPYYLAYLFSKTYPRIRKALQGCDYRLSQGLPLCVWDEKQIAVLAREKRIVSICQLLKGYGILFDTDLSVIPCNAMYQLKYGRLDKDFFDLPSYQNYMKKDSVKALFSQLRGVPSQECLKCGKARFCGGGCVTNWTNYSFEELSTKLKEEFLQTIKRK